MRRGPAIALALGGLAWAAAAQAAQAPALQAVAAFGALCATGELTPQAVLARAEAAGWRRGGPDAPKDFDPQTQRLSPAGGAALRLMVTSETSLGERRDTCGVGGTAPMAGVVAATGAWLGFPPALDLRTTGTFYAVRTGEAWASGAKLDHAAFAGVKAEGRFYSIVTSDEPAAMLLLLHVRPAP
ncbi:MAG: hypothetical protein E7812_09725 [Phenylobacterium sp.]|nr:MAG: hypothetical protein E7812_09725 [Phenylobacterium sp.]